MLSMRAAEWANYWKADKLAARRCLRRAPLSFAWNRSAVDRPEVPSSLNLTLISVVQARELADRAAALSAWLSGPPQLVRIWYEGWARPRI